MAITHHKSRKKPTGGLRRLHRKKKKYEKGNPFLPATIGPTKRKALRTIGGGQKMKLLKADSINLQKSGKMIRAKVKQVIENPANPFFVRRNILTKGAIVETDKGFARVTSRPGQQGQVNAVFLKDYEPPKK